MEQILKGNITLPEWSLKNVNQDEYDSLSNSIRNNGQTKNILVRQISKDKYEVIDGKNVFKILSTMNKDFIWCHVYRDISEIEAMLIYLQHDFYFQNNFVEVSKVIEKVHKKITKLEISKKTKYSYSEVIELLSLAKYDFEKFNETKNTKQSNLF